MSDLAGDKWGNQGPKSEKGVVYVQLYAEQAAELESRAQVCHSPSIALSADTHLM